MCTIYIDASGPATVPSPNMHGPLSLLCRELSLTAFTLSQGTHPDEYLPPRLTRLHLDVDPDKIPAQLLRLNVSAATLHLAGCCLSSSSGLPLLQQLLLL